MWYEPRSFFGMPNRRNITVDLRNPILISQTVSNDMEVLKVSVKKLYLFNCVKHFIVKCNRVIVRSFCVCVRPFFLKASWGQVLCSFCSWAGSMSVRQKYFNTKFYSLKPRSQMKVPVARMKYVPRSFLRPKKQDKFCVILQLFVFSEN